MPGYVPEEGDAGIILTAGTGVGAFDFGPAGWGLTYFDAPDEVLLYFIGGVAPPPP